MATLVLHGGQVVSPLAQFNANVFIGNGLIQAVSEETIASGSSYEVLDVADCYVTPGLVDLQVNGTESCNFWGDPSAAQVELLCRSMLQAGVTTILPTLITDDLAHMNKNISFLQSLGVGDKESGALVYGLRMPGIHLEGPCLSPQRTGVHPRKHIQPFAIQVLDQIVKEPVLMMTAAIELDPEGGALRWLQKRNITVSLGHSNATFSEASSAFDRGVAMMTHTYNALPSFHHRAPGAVAAALLDQRVSCCVICDGLHVDSNAVRLLFRMKGPERTILVTDVAKVGTTGGGLVGSSILLDEAVRNVVSWKVATFPESVRMASWNPAESIGLQHSLGLIEAGRKADLIVWERDTLSIRHVIVDGQLVGGRAS